MIRTRGTLLLPDAAIVEAETTASVVSLVRALCDSLHVGTGKDHRRDRGQRL